jgi:hypothetical protein
MGLIAHNVPAFNLGNLLDRELMLRMLQAEDKLYMSNLGQELIKAHGGNISVESGKVLQRSILRNFGFQGSDEDVKIMFPCRII